MTKKELRTKLGALLDQCPDTAWFLEGVSDAIENIYADDEEGGCADGFAALDAAREAFEACESDDRDGDDEDEEEDEDDE